MLLTRRHLLSALPALAMPAILRPQALWARAPQTLALPALDEGRMIDGVRVFDLKVARATTQFMAGQSTDTIGINAPYLGPNLRIKSGETVRFDVTNALDQPTSLHWHGLHLPPAMDGGPHQPIAPGALWQPSFRVQQRAGTYWFHSHAHGQTGAQIWAGMAGLIRIEDDEEAALPLPRTYGEDDFSLIIQDRRFDADGQMTYEPGMHDIMAGMQGDQMLVNGQIGAVLTSAAPRIRLRILNGANASIYRLHFADGRTFQQIASDGGLLAAPVAMSETTLAPGERGEYLVDLHDGAATMLRAELFGAMAASMGSDGIRDVIALQPVAAQAPAPDLPARLGTLSPALPGPDARRVFSLTMGEGHTMGGMMMDDDTMMHGAMMGADLINGALFDPDRIDFTVPEGANETWVFENRADMLHPIHIHGTQFRILSRNGQPAPAHEQGWKDVVLTRPGETVELSVAFSAMADPSAPLMLHCHILEHEDAGMMQQFTII